MLSYVVNFNIDSDKLKIEVIRSRTLYALNVTNSCYFMSRILTLTVTS